MAEVLSDVPQVSPKLPHGKWLIIDSTKPEQREV